MCSCRTSLGSIVLDPDTAEECYGPVIKTMLPGQSFGELALLQPNSLRTATIVAVPCQYGSKLHGCQTRSCVNYCQNSRPQDGEPNEDRSGCAVMLLRLTQQLFDEAVTSLQVAQLEERLQFLMRFKAGSSLNPCPCSAARHCDPTFV